MSVAEFAESIIDTSAQQARSATAVLRRGKYLRTDGSDIVVEVAGGEVTVTSALTDGQTLVADEPVLLLQQGYEYVLIKPSAPVVDTSGFVEKAGDTMTGELILPGDPQSDLSAATKAYVDATSSNDASSAVAAHEAASDPHGQYVLNTGDTMTGELILPGDPTFNLSAATKQFAESIAASEADAAEAAAKAYADTGDSALDSAKVNRSGDTMTGNLDANGLVTGKVWASSYWGIQNGANNSSSGPALLMGNSVNGGPVYLIGGSGQSVNIRPRVDLGGTYDHNFSTAGLTLPVSPTAANHATRKDYVDAKSNGVGSSGLILYNLSPGSDYTIPGSGTYYTVPGCSISIAGPCSLHVGWTLSYNAPSWTNVVNIYAKITCTGASSASASGRSRFGPAVNTGSAAEMNVNSSVVLNVPSGTVNIYGQCYQSNTSNSGMSIVAGYTMLSIFGIKWT